MRVVKIWDADIYRDGGSYGFCFDADDGHWYELFMQTTAFDDDKSATHRPPVIYFEGCNSGHVVQNLSWDEAKVFIKHLSYNNHRFSELALIVANEGRELTG
ncbi:hypothetical protein D9M09_13235 [Janthinobacterium agaricidamnosum]|uniref:Uncharacterized protein n=1 Tax=Janthinobacterium agaricidamnosum TaxID=55508 RepID=A0A3G2E8S6_9BURK|nr:hypothetical protein [Janthinobacterium agaricidamnosum]AYM76651.1 hypothetical protein D9M09_13235 [Janthinobacterium agaricidamnosum]